jgi:hypothetical protein
MSHSHLETKPCRECRALRPLDRFLPSRVSPDGHGVRCRECIFAEARRNREDRERRRVLVVPVKIKSCQRLGAPQPQSGSEPNGRSRSESV